MAAMIGGVPLLPLGEIAGDRGRWLIHGPQGAGKSTLASSIAGLGKTLYIDLTGERGVRSFVGAEYAGNISVARPESVTALDDIFWHLAEGEHDYAAVVLDSLTALQKMALRYLMGHSETAVKEIQQNSKPADMQTWGRALDIMTDTAVFWYGLADSARTKPLHVVMTAQSRPSETEGILSYAPDVQKGAVSIVMATPDYVVYCDTVTDPNATEFDAPPVHVVRFGNDQAYRIKARLPVHLRGKLPQILGYKKPTSLAQLTKILGLGS